MESADKLQERTYKIYTILKKRYPDARTLLNYQNPFELLVATILSAQCTDERVNNITPALFEKFPTPVSLASADLTALEVIIRPTGFYRNKAKNLKRMAEALVAQYHSTVPSTIDSLSSLPGVGRKTANVVAGNCFTIPAIIVDTHVRRVATRLGLTKSNNPDKIEAELRELCNPEDQTQFSHVLGFHGRYICKARKPNCAECPVTTLCPFPDK